jgi:surfactin synthase thioesterase subunit
VGPPLVCLHGFADTWRAWELVLPALERHHDVLAVTLAGHAGGPPIAGEISDVVLADAVERAMDEAGFETAHIVGNSLGGYVALQLASRSRARTVVALAPAGGWARDDESYRDLLALQSKMHELVKAAAPHAEAVLASPQGRRRATQHTVMNFEHIPTELLAHQMLGMASCAAALPLIDHALREGYSLDAEKITCPVRVLWGWSWTAWATALNSTYRSRPHNSSSASLLAEPAQPLAVASRYEQSVSLARERGSLAPAGAGSPSHGARTPRGGPAKESNLPSVGLPRPAGFEGRMGHQARAAPGWS